jgi:hypothetical protein
MHNLVFDLIQLHAQSSILISYSSINTLVFDLNQLLANLVLNSYNFMQNLVFELIQLHEKSSICSHTAP